MGRLYIYLHEWLMFMVKYVGKYTVRPMDAYGKVKPVTSSKHRSVVQGFWPLVWCQGWYLRTSTSPKKLKGLEGQSVGKCVVCFLFVFFTGCGCCCCCCCCCCCSLLFFSGCCCSLLFLLVVILLYCFVLLFFFVFFQVHHLHVSHQFPFSDSVSWFSRVSFQAFGKVGVAHLRMVEFELKLVQFCWNIAKKGKPGHTSDKTSVRWLQDWILIPGYQGGLERCFLRNKWDDDDY